MGIQLKRAYEKAERGDGFRVLIDRLWPRGVAKEEAKIDRWLKEAAPSTALRKWFGHDPDKWEEFKKRYDKELAEHEEALNEIRQQARGGMVTLVYGAKDVEHNDAVAMLEYLKAGGRVAKKR
jgi:uncharacterized protein YeaO (DUF488 family)